MTAGENLEKGLLLELKAHLRAQAPRGVPADWFARAAGARQAPLPPEIVQLDAVGAPSAETMLTEHVDAPRPVREGGDWSSLSLAQLEEEALGCKRCRLCETRNKVVFGVGNASPRLVFVGEGPGADEDRQGEPFVGKAGALLTAAITRGMGLSRSDVYICNVVKCRPPGNRAPLPDEVAACTSFLYRQLELLQPEVIVALGGPAQAALSGVPGGITRIRGQWQQWRDIKLMPTFHPAYILRNPSAKRLFWEDLQEVMKVLGISLPQASRTANGE